MPYPLTFSGSECFSVGICFSDILRLDSVRNGLLFGVLKYNNVGFFSKTTYLFVEKCVFSPKTCGMYIAIYSIAINKVDL